MPSYTHGLPIARAEVEGSEGIQISVTYVQNNQIAIAGSAPGTNNTDPTSETVQRRLLRSPIREDSARDGSTGPTRTEG